MEKDTKFDVIQYYTDSFLKDNLVDPSICVFITTVEQLATLEPESCSSIFLNQVLNRTYEFEKSVADAKSKLKPQGILFSTLLSIAPSLTENPNYWGFTPAAANYFFGKYFSDELVSVCSYGNVYIGRYLIKPDKLLAPTPEQLTYADPFFPVFVGVVAKKL